MRRAALLAVLLALPASAADDPPLTVFGDLAQRPPFVASRRPTAGATQLNAASLRLTGLVTELGRTIALVRSDEKKGETRIGTGATLNGWSVTAIDRSGLDLQAAGQRRHVGLKQPIPPSPE